MDTNRPPPKWLLLLQELRAPFLTASIVPILLGTALAYSQTGQWHWSLFLLALAAMALIHSGANVANDYFDHLSGNDAANVDFVRPFTGGSRMIQNGLLTPREVLVLSLVCLATGSLIGLYLVVRVGLPILVLGIVGVLGGFLYTAPRVFLVARGVGEPIIAINFGILPVLGAYYVQTGRFNWHVALLSLPVAFLIAAILFINQFQDYEADKAVGKRNWVVRLGRKRAVGVFAGLMTLWTVPIVVAVALRLVSPWCLVALLPLVTALKAIVTARRYHDAPQQLTPANALTVITHLLVGLLLSAALLSGCGKKQGRPGQAEPGAFEFARIEAVRLPISGDGEAAAYLGLEPGGDTFALTDIRATVLVIHIFDMYCMNCQKDAPDVNRLHQQVADSDLAGRVRFLGIGKGNTKMEAGIYDERYEVPFPLFADPNKENVKRLGIEETPSFIIVDLPNRRVIHSQWRIGSVDEFVERLRKQPF